tara:strand:- start:425 stop:823 length:399 start_codon:yes stop_codon:yes gene_type:complete
MNTIIKYLIAILIGSIIGFIGGFQGIAGGFYISTLLLLTGIASTQKMAAGTTLLSIVFPLSIGAVYEYWKSGDVDVGVGLIIAFFYMIFAYMGADVRKHFSDNFVILSLALLLLLTSFYYFYKYHQLIYKVK